MIKPISFEYEKIKFPVGEMHIRIAELLERGNVDLLWEFESNEEIIEILLVADALKNAGFKIRTLSIPYIPFARQDRVSVEGECFSLRVFANLINSIEVDRISVVDPHSDVSTALIKNLVVTEQWQVFEPYLKDKSKFYLVSPDGGALKKIYKLASKVNCLGVIECSKHRNVKDGKITGVKTYFPKEYNGEDLYIVDDICDGGRTFVEIAKEIKKQYNPKINLMITHGFFTKGLGVFDGLIDKIYTRKGEIR